MKKLCLPYSNNYLLLTFCGFLLACGNAEEGQQTMEFPPTEVVVHQVESSSAVLSTELPGRTSAFRYAEVRPQVSGIIVERLYEEGAYVEAGQSLYQIDDREYRADLLVKQASVATAEAAFQSAELRYLRFTRVIGSNGVSQQDLDEAEIALNQARANLESAQASLNLSEINLQYTQVLAPISGRIGRSSVTEGALVTAQQAEPMALIHQLDPIFVDLSRAAQELLDLRMRIQSGEVQELSPARVEISFENGSSYLHLGQLEFSEVQVSETTGTLVMRAIFPNPDELLLPGMFVRAKIQEGIQENAILVPQQSVSRDRTGGAMVYLVNAENVVEIRLIQTSQVIGDQWLVTSGLSVGDRIVLEGVQKIQPGAPVSPILADSQE